MNTVSPAKEQGTLQDLHESTSQYWATELPQLTPRMLLPRRMPRDAPFPFSSPSVQYVHFARNAIYHLIQQRALSGEEVLVPAYFHGVELEALVAGGACPRFYGVREGMRVDVEDIRAAITPATRAVYLIHYAGYPGPAEEVAELCRQRGLFFIEDCALALLSKAGDRPLGSFGDAAVFCLYKTLPTPDGGAVVLREGSLSLEGTRPGWLGTAKQTAASVLTHMERRGAPPARVLATAAKKVGKALVRQRGEDWVEVGTQNFDIGAANSLMSSTAQRIVASQKFDDVVEKRRRNYLHLQSLLSDLAPPVFNGLPDGMCPLFYPFATEHKIALWQRLRGEGIQSVLFWLGGEAGPQPGKFPEVDTLRHTILELPCHQDLTEPDIERVAMLVRRHLRELNS